MRILDAQKIIKDLRRQVLDGPNGRWLGWMVLYRAGLHIDGHPNTRAEFNDSQGLVPDYSSAERALEYVSEVEEVAGAAGGLA